MLTFAPFAFFALFTPAQVPADAVEAGDVEAGAVEAAVDADVDAEVAEVADVANADVVATAAREASGRQLVAVLDLKSTPGERGLALALTTVLTAEIAAIPGYAALSRNEIKAIVEHQADASLAGCDSDRCLADLAKLMDANLVVTGSVERIQDAVVFALTLVDPAGPTVLNRQEVAWHSDPDEMVALARPYATRLLGGADAAHHTGALEVLANDGAAVFVDGVASGTTPLKAPLESLSTGAHRVIVSKDGCESVAKDVVVARGESTILHVELVEQPFYTQWWFWTATVGSVLAAGGVAGGIGTWAALNQDVPTHLVVGVKR